MTVAAPARPTGSAAGKPKPKGSGAGGGKLMSEINAEYQEWADRQPAKSSCAIPGCRWRFSGTAKQARDAAAAHRAEAHPALRPRSVQQIANAMKREEKEKMAERKRAEAAARAPAAASRREIPYRARWTVEAALEAVRVVAADLGHPPTAVHAKKDRRLPSGPTVTKLFGTHAEMIEQAGFPRPTRSTRYGRGSASGTPEPSPVVPPAPKPEAPEEPAGVDEAAESQALPDGLVAFVYVVLRDALPAGRVEEIVRDVRKHPEKRFVFSNHGLEEYARDVAGRLLRSAA